MATRSINRKLSRARDHRRLLIRTLATQLVMHKSITTTMPRARVLRPYIERLVSRGQRGDLHARRYVRARLDTVEATHELIDVIAKQSARKGGYVRVKKAGFKAGDNTPLARVSFVDSFSAEVITKKPTTETKKTTTTRKSAAKPKAKTSNGDNKTSGKKSTQKSKAKS